MTCFVASPVVGQNQPQGEGAQREDALRVFLDCSSFQCDEDYIRRQVTFVNYVRDRNDAQLHVLVTTQRTGSGGTEFTLRFIGQGEFAAQRDTLTYASTETQTEDEIRRGLVRVYKAGLMDYVSRTPLFEDVEISYNAEDPGRAEQPGEDSWNYWVFDVGGNFGMDGERQQNEIDLSGRISANRTTHDWKIDMDLSGSYSREIFEVGDGHTLESLRHELESDLMIVRSLSPHWSAGVVADVGSSTFRNYDLNSGVAPAIEYNLFPYSVSTSKQFRFLYQVETNYYDYRQRTIFNKLNETRFEQELEVTLDFNQPWGSVHTSITGSNYLYDFSKHNVDVFSNLELRIYRGLSLDLFGSVSLIRDQLNLPAEEATQEEILLRRRELATNYRYFFRIGLNYTFGSIYNNIVNPRFGGGGGRWR